MYSGRTVNPVQAELQTEGNVAFGLGQALYEELLYDGGQLQNGTLADYMIASFRDMPPELGVTVLEGGPDAEVHGIGETSLPAVMPAVGNAVFRACGARITDLPITAEKVLRALRDERRGRGGSGRARAAGAGRMIELTLNVNGAGRAVRARPQHTLVDVLRNELGLSSVREGCGVGMCGACTVLLDGEPVSGCLVLAAAAEGREIRTLESLAPDGVRLAPVQQAFAEHTAFQCSFCTPGFLLTAQRLLEERPAATDEEIAEYLAGNLCRCGSYVKILDAVRSLTVR